MEAPRSPLRMVPSPRWRVPREERVPFPPVPLIGLQWMVRPDPQWSVTGTGKGLVPNLA